MVLTSHRSKRKSTGKKYISYRGKRIFEIRHEAALTKVGDQKVKTRRSRSGLVKRFLLAAKQVNVYDSKSKKYSKVEIKEVVENSANRHFVRRNIVTKGSVVATSLGNVKITSRPGQEAVLNGVLVK
jgi:small subunit ribosomal protein S8e